MKALSLWQPWPSLIAHGLKQYETRGWYTSHRGPLAIHASKRWTPDEAAMLDLLANQFNEVYNALSYPMPLGAVVCICNLITCIPTNNLQQISRMERAVGDFSPGRFAWRLELVEVFEEPIPAKGKQGLWDWSRPV